MAGLQRIGPRAGAALGIRLPQPKRASHHKPKGIDFNLAKPTGRGQQPGAADGDIDTKASRKVKQP